MFRWLLVLLLLSDPAQAGPIRASAPEAARSGPPTDGLVLYYPFEGGSEDASGNGNHATAFGTSLVEDKFGNPSSAYYFDGTDAFLRAPVDISPSVMPQITLVAWARPEQINGDISLFAHATENRARRKLSILVRPHISPSWATNTNSTGSWTWHPVDPGEWVFLALSYDQPGKKHRLHVNDHIYEADCVQNEGATTLDIGRNPADGEHFHGVLDEIRIYDRVLEEAEIKALYNEFLHGRAEEVAAGPGGNRLGLAAAFLAGFGLFAGLLLAVNLMIRGKTSLG